jgi:hypothetical protein
VNRGRAPAGGGAGLPPSDELLAARWSSWGWQDARALNLYVVAAGQQAVCIWRALVLCALLQGWAWSAASVSLQGDSASWGAA